MSWLVYYYTNILIYSIGLSKYKIIYKISEIWLKFEYKLVYINNNIDKQIIIYISCFICVKQIDNIYNIRNILFVKNKYKENVII